MACPTCGDDMSVLTDCGLKREEEYDPHDMIRYCPACGTMKRPLVGGGFTTVVPRRSYVYAAMKESHRKFCTPDNCVIDGGPLHALAFAEAINPPA